MKNYEKYVGHPSQLCGVEEVALLKGKGKGMTLLEIRNGKGLQVTLSADRAMDISRINYEGVNMGYFAPCGYVAPAFYDNKGSGFLKSFTAGFLTTCGLTAVGSPCVDDGEELPLHGGISNVPCDNYSYSETDDEITVSTVVREAAVFAHKMQLSRKLIISKNENSLTIEDEIENIGSEKSPFMILYHFNMGYPLLTENSKLVIDAVSVKSRDAEAEKYFNSRLEMEKPQAGFAERCYYYDMKSENGIAGCSIYNPDIKKGLKMSYTKETLDCFTEWKMMGEGEYVLGLEPGNCNPDGRDVLRKEGRLKFLEPKEKCSTKIEFVFTGEEK